MEYSELAASDKKLIAVFVLSSSFMGRNKSGNASLGIPFKYFDFFLGASIHVPAKPFLTHLLHGRFESHETCHFEQLTHAILVCFLRLRGATILLGPDITTNNPTRYSYPTFLSLCRHIKVVYIIQGCVIICITLNEAVQPVKSENFFQYASTNELQPDKNSDKRKRGKDKYNYIRDNTKVIEFL